MKLNSNQIREIIKEEHQKLVLERKSHQLIRESILILEAQEYTDEEILDTLLTEGWWQNLYDGSVDAIKSKLSAMIVDTILGAFDVDVNTKAGS